MSDPKHSQLEKHDPVAVDPRNVEFHTRVWSSGTQGGGKVPADFGWKSNPKQHQEEYGSPEVAEATALSGTLPPGAQALPVGGAPVPPGPQTPPPLAGKKP